MSIRDDFLTDAKTVNDVVQFFDTNLKKIVDSDLQWKIEEKEQQSQQQLREQQQQ